MPYIVRFCKGLVGDYCLLTFFLPIRSTSYENKSEEHILKNLVTYCYEVSKFEKIITPFESARKGLLRKKLKLGQGSKIELSRNFF